MKSLRSLRPVRVSQEEVLLIAGSGWFDTTWYRSQVDSRTVVEGAEVEDYLRLGSREGLSPSDRFDPAWYLSSNPDVRTSGLEPLVHFLRFGLKEGRQARRSEIAVLPAASTTRRGDIRVNREPPSGMPFYTASAVGNQNLVQESDQSLEALAISGAWFDPDWYRGEARLSWCTSSELFDHYLGIGWTSGYSPSRRFDGPAYLRANPRLIDLQVEPLTHFLLWGESQGLRAMPVDSRQSLGSVVELSSRYRDSWLEAIADGVVGEVLVIRWRERRRAGAWGHGGVDSSSARRRVVEFSLAHNLVEWDLQGPSEWIARELARLLISSSAQWVLIAEHGVGMSGESAAAIAAAATDGVHAVIPLITNYSHVLSAGYRILPDGGLKAVGAGWGLDHDLLGVNFTSDAPSSTMCLVRVDSINKIGSGGMATRSLQAMLSLASIQAKSEGSTCLVVASAIAISETHDSEPDVVAGVSMESSIARAHIRDRVRQRKGVATSVLMNSLNDILSAHQRRYLVDLDGAPSKELGFSELMRWRIVERLRASTESRCAVRYLPIGAPHDWTAKNVEEIGVEVWRKMAHGQQDGHRIVSRSISFAENVEFSDSAVFWVSPSSPVVKSSSMDWPSIVACPKCVMAVRNALQSCEQISRPIIWSAGPPDGAMSEFLTTVGVDVAWRVSALDATSALLMVSANCKSCQVVGREAAARGLSVRLWTGDATTDLVPETWKSIEDSLGEFLNDIKLDEARQ